MGVEIASIFRAHGADYRKQYEKQMSPEQKQAMRAIEHCRTEALGGHVYRCQTCDEIQYSYHSCRNRHCPKCQNEKGQAWLDKQQDFLLPVPYYLLTFTLPAEIRPVARRYQAEIYTLLFRASAAATQKLAQDARFIGGQIGMIGVLHTWGRNLSYHPHVHYLVPAGGLSENGDHWLPARKNFLLPVKALSKIFRAIFRKALQKTDCFAEIPVSVWQQDWVVHCQAVGTGEHALKYLAPYIFRVAISNHRILSFQDGDVTFRYKASGTGKKKLCSFTAHEFIRRFLLHILPKGFVKVRYYGFFSAGCRKKLATIRQKLGVPYPVENDCQEPFPVQNISCPQCGQSMQHYRIIEPEMRVPP